MATSINTTENSNITSSPLIQLLKEAGQDSSPTIEQLLMDGQPMRVVFLIVQCLQGFLILLANILTVLTLIRMPSLRCVTSQFLIHLCIADLLTSLLPLLSVTRYNLALRTTPWSGVCFIEKLILMISLVGNMTFTLSVAIDRYVYMAFPLRYEILLTPTRVRLSTSATWALVVIQGTITTIITHPIGTEECIYSGLLVSGAFYFVILADFLVCSLCSLAVMGRYVRIMWKQSRQTGAWMGSVAVAGKENKEMTNMICGVIFIHVACFTPSFIIGALIGKREVPDATSQALLVLNSAAATVILINSWIKPPIYFWKNKLYRTAYKENFRDVRNGQIAPRPMPARVVTVPL